VCQLIYVIIFVPYNLFKLFLVDKILVYKYIYMKMGKRKKKRDSQLAGPGGGGDFGPTERGRAGERGGRRPTRHASGKWHGDDTETAPWAWAHVPEGG
jgi:hypothetical protein